MCSGAGQKVFRRATECILLCFGFFSWVLGEVDFGGDSVRVVGLE